MNDERSANMIDRSLGQRVRARRLEAGLSQERLADLLGLTFQQIQKYEKGVNRIAASRLFDISAALDVPVTYFFDGLSPNAARGVAETAADGMMFDTLATPEGLQLMTLFSGIKNVRVRRRVVELVRALVEDEPEARGEKPAK
ncbi:MAG: helix-turn-helix domain-containing protein [Hyphomonadaceae bacterium]